MSDRRGHADREPPGRLVGSEGEATALRQEIEELKEERELLLEAGEDLELLAGISERIKRADDEDQMIDTLLESICVLKDLDYAVLWRRTDDRYVVTNQYANGPAPALIGRRTAAGEAPALERATRTGRATASSNSVSKQIASLLPAENKKYVGRLLVSLRIGTKAEGVIGAVGSGRGPKNIEELALLLERAVTEVAARIENLRLVQDIKQLNKKLRRKYAKRGAALAESEAKYRDLIENAGEAIATCDLNGNITSWNPAAKDLLGYEEDEIIGRPVSIISDAETMNEQAHMVEEIKSGRMSRTSLETTRRHKDGHRIPVEISISPVRTADGRAVGCEAIMRDIGERKRHEAELAESERKYRQLFERANDAIFLIDPETGRIVEANRRASLMDGYSLEELQTMRVLDLHPSEERSRIPRALAEVAEKGEASLASFHHITKEGRLVPIEINAVMVEAHGRRLNLSIVRDISERERSERLRNEKELAVREAYADALRAFTGGRLVIVPHEDLRSELGEPISGLSPIDSFRELAKARSETRAALSARFDNQEAIQRLLLAAGEAMANAVKHSKRGNVSAYDRDGRAQVAVMDSGSGIDFSVLPKATLVAGFSTKVSLGMGFSIMLDLCDRVVLATGPQGTSLILELTPETAARPVKDDRAGSDK